ncbi:CLAVATA3/ESR (CLE)-related protein 1-like [Raphanus sativus]|uniref:CLAVATA3/ESR (CLE)-related protein 1-like n=1 Tax=Raphanus sativus TaxID=3726 RepID=A0A9W3CMV9_RAPSA|nr:CLAVATA3/ESR (CLE)-related protein 1-like [Raphanus sativus]
MANLKFWLCLFLICVSFSRPSARPMQQLFANAEGNQRGPMIGEAEKVLKANIMERAFNQPKRLCPGGPNRGHH